MTKLLNEAIELLCRLPESLQDTAARAVLLQLEEEAQSRDFDAIAKARTEITQGEFVSLEQWRHDMGGSHR